MHSDSAPAHREHPVNVMVSNPIAAEELKPTSELLVQKKAPERDPGEILPWLPCTVTLEIPLIKFSVGTLLNLAAGSIVETGYHQSSDLPLSVNGQLVGWTEFEVVGDRLAVRLTDLS